MTLTLDCGRAEELLPDLVAGELGEPLAGEARTHLAGCANCSALHAALRELAVLLAPEPDPGLPEGFVERVAARSWARGRVRPAAARMPWGLQLAAGLVSVVVGGAAFFGGMARQDPASTPGRMVRRAVNTSLAVRERATRVMEELRLLQVVVATAFEGRVERVNDRVEDYRRLMEKLRDQKPSPATDRREPGGAAAELFPNSPRASLVEARGQGGWPRRQS